MVSSEQMSSLAPGQPPCGPAGWPSASGDLSTPGTLTSAPLLSQVQALEQRNQLLETRWHFLQGQDSGTFDLGHLYEGYQARLQEELRKVNQERGQLEASLLQVLQKVEEFRIRWAAPRGAVGRDGGWEPTCPLRQGPGHPSRKMRKGP